MAVQPARMTQVDLGVLPVPRRLRQPRRLGGDAHVSRAVAKAPARAGMPIRTAAPVRSATPVRTATQPVRVVATPWSAVEANVRGRLRPAAILLATLIVATMLGLVYMTQVLAAQNARYAVDSLLMDRQALMRTLASQEASIVQWGSEAQVRQWAQAEGLDPLGSPKRFKGR